MEGEAVKVNPPLASDSVAANACLLENSTEALA
jgi:hypothetical protein